MTLQQALTMQHSADGPPRLWVEVSANASVTVNGEDQVLRGVYNATSAAGSVSVMLLDGSTITIPNIPSGHIVPGFFLQVGDSGTLDPDNGDVLGVI